MTIIKTAIQLKKHLKTVPAYPEATGFVPTMGALHQGHLSLVEASRQKQGLTVASIFVNPTQFNEPADFQNYPVTIERDIRMLESAGCDILFLPSLAEIYPNGTGQGKHYDLGPLEKTLEGLHRPGHFQGVCQVVERLLTIVEPGNMYLGRKDYQQYRVLQRMLDITGLKVQLHLEPTVREKNGLAMSSRNMRLTPSEKEQAASIFRQLQLIKQSIGEIPLAKLVENATHNLLTDGFEKVDYVAVADPDTLAPLPEMNKKVPAVALVAAFLNGVRLIDNIEIAP